MTPGAQVILTLTILSNIILPAVALYGIFKKGGYEPWKAIVPFYNVYVWLEMLGRPRWWFVFYLVPGLGYLLVVVLSIELIKSFGKFGFWQHFLMFIPFANYLYIAYLAYSPKEKYHGNEYARKNYRRSSTREWADAILFAVVAAMVIRSLFIEAYTIPTGSMKQTLLVNDYLFVSKLNYGARVPMTPVAFPLAHNVMPFFGGKSYIQWPSLPYYRFPGWEKIERNDIVVFNYPADENPHPVDKKENYIKRCVAIAGDSIASVGGDLFINGKRVDYPKEAQLHYQMLSKEIIAGANEEKLKEFGVFNPKNEHETEVAPSGMDSTTKLHKYELLLTAEQLEEVKKLPFVVSVTRVPYQENLNDPGFFARDPAVTRNMDNFDAFLVPKKGITIQLNPRNYYLYQTAIRNYEGNESFQLVDSTVYLNGQPATEYTFKMDYYFMMGDNRYNSADSRAWGFVPEDHIVGKPVLIWFSWEYNNEGFFDKIRWSRLFNGIRAE